MRFEFDHDDPRLGLYAPDGAIARWPVQDVNGGPYNKTEVTVKGILGGAYFVVLPPGLDHPDHDYTVRPNPSAGDPPRKVKKE